MLLAYSVLIILFIVIAVLLLILFKSDGADSDVLRATMCVGLIIIELIIIIGLIGSSKTGKIYRTEYDKLIQNIEKDKTKVIKENDEITDIYITVNGEEYHFEISKGE
jgi:hypothetical protein